jgi:hypothetical protein
VADLEASAKEVHIGFDDGDAGRLGGAQSVESITGPVRDEEGSVCRDVRSWSGRTGRHCGQG